MKTHLLGTLTLATILAAGAIPAQELPSTTLSYVGSWSSLTLYKDFEQPFWGQHLTEASDGQVQVDVTTFDQMGLKGGEVFSLLSKGVFDIGSTVGDYTVSDAPELEGMDMPMIAPELENARDVVRAYKPVLDDILSERFGGAKLIAAVPYPPQVVFCNAEIDGLASLEGKKIRASGRSTAEFLESVGAEGITLAFSEVPGALQRGVIDCAVTGSLSGYSAGWYEVSTHLYPLPVGGWDYVVTAMNGEAWEGMAAELQEWLLRQVEQHYEQPVWDNAAREVEEGIACLTGNGECAQGEPGDMTLVEASEEDFDLAQRMLEEQVLPAWVGRVDADDVARWNETIGEVTGVTASER
ncbi:TRAP-type C4-dicarboxylate transport system, substrate-binding protein [Modicisalibacter ilicicola DSM 19980]|uniref:TRAP-type C4-dicarboxylate transport system, substrate-binding protein n=1 Tax=Modicisalibacter ilicicola DSM 19980 TaxID=1121942 RepID=A0A1M5CFZ0_9GAMM|nr:TRAP transporter substrate-binding protein [Halomonas ilicicola]SHF53586.1 TRAP-type C4-dicarboxylate transport system, substrate-binding protein [Halomonas ilicicola DSM 19980]